MIRRALADDIAAHRAWWARFALLCAIFAAIVVTLLGLTACQVGPPCSNHGGVHWTNAKVYQCNDGTWE